MARYRLNPFMVTTGGQSVPYISDELEGTWPATARHVQRHEEAGTRYVIRQMDDGFYHIVNAATGRSSGKYASTPQKAQQLAGKLMRRTNPDVERRPSSRQVQRRVALAPHLHEQMEEQAAHQAEMARLARAERVRNFKKHVKNVVDALVKKYSALTAAGKKWRRFDVIDDLVDDPLIHKNFDIYVEDDLTQYIVEASLPAHLQRHPMHTGYLQDRAHALIDAMGDDRIE